MSKRFMKLIKCVAIAVMCICGASSCGVGNQDSMNGISVQMSLNRNDQIRKDASNGEPFTGYGTSQYGEVLGVFVDIKEETAEFSDAFNISLKGEITEVIAEDVTGYVAVFEGNLEDGTRIIADLVFTKADMFAGITLNKQEMEIVFYGDITDDVGKIMNEYAKDVNRSHEAIW